ncbi:MAG: hypothetical protein KDC54_17980 [Lewinella sp.]|nr:hypothetical protein [Lewinella sp.]
MAEKVQQTSVSFEQLLSQFPEIELPVVLGEDTHHVFSRENDPLHAAVIDQFLLPLEEEEMDEMTEFVPCFRLPGTKDYRAIVYWKAGLLHYQYRLVTYDKKGNFIDGKVIAGTTFDGEDVTRSMATITDQYQVYIVSGQQQFQLDDYDAKMSTAVRFQISNGGKIVEL